MSNDSADLDLSFERLLLESENDDDGDDIDERALCSKGGYTHRIVVYAGRVEKSDGSVAEKSVFELMEQYLMRGRRLFADNWYSSISLAQRLIQNETDFVGTFRRNRRGFPKRLVQKKQKKGEIMALRKDGITLMNWHDKRSVMMMSTCHGPDTNDKGKSTMVEDYNYSKLFVDNSDQMAAYYPFVVRTCSWYVRLFFHLITQTSLVNAYRLYCRSAQKISFLNFKINIVEALLQPEPEVSTPKTSR
uniref:PiggyBac transposable element-derived protein domain-containing protein n=1 Tax=Acrobeloides nanus TaxID=290746 RepID=A0A914D5G0_9BILA